MTQVRDAMKKQGATALAVSALDEVAWLFNIRGSDIPFNPVAYSYAVVTTDQAYFCIDPSKLSDEVKTHLNRVPTECS